jgi:hypothetical protein
VQQWHFAVGGSKKITPDSEFSFSLFYSPVAKVSGVNMFATGQTISIEMHQVEAEIGYSRKF